MKQLLQSLRTGMTLLADLPLPQLRAGTVLVRTGISLVSPGTEKALVEFTGKGILAKAWDRPDLVRQVLNKLQREGPVSAYRAALRRLDSLIPLGYSSAGEVLAVGERVEGIQVADRVACAGGGYAVHGEVICVPKNLVVRLPENVDFESAAFTTLGAIALQGIRLAEAKLGEIVAVIGLGVLGQLAVQILKAAGCIVVGMDIQRPRAELARQVGADAVATDAEGLSSIVHRLSSGHGADAVLITADTPTNQPVEVAGEVARDRGRVVAVGAVGMTIPRKPYYEKELDIRISRSYGPGRYDPDYEEKGHDYPIGYVRWTENRNMQAFLQLLAWGKGDVKALITHRFPIEEAPKAYDLITGKTGEPFLGVLITYPSFVSRSGSAALLTRRVDFKRATAPSSETRVDRARASAVAIGLFGAGNFATATLLPAMKKVRSIEFVGVCTATGPSGRHAGEKFGFRYCTTDENEILNDPKINTVVIATRDHLHARQVIAALNAGKHVHCEKPLALKEDKLREIVQAMRRETGQSSPLLMVGFNRRFAPMARALKNFLSDVNEPLVMHYRVNAGYIPPGHWVHDPEQSGGRIIGEVCHFVDFLTFLAGALPVQVHARALPNEGRYRDDNVVINLELANGSLGTIVYVANGDKAFPKERVEVFGGGCIAVLDDFRRLELVRHGRKRVYKSRLHLDKGHRAEWEAFVAAVGNSAPPPIPFEQIVATTLTTFRVLDALHCGTVTRVDTESFVISAMTREKEREGQGDKMEDPKPNP